MIANILIKMIPDWKIKIHIINCYHINRNQLKVLGMSYCFRALKICRISIRHLIFIMSLWSFQKLIIMAEFSNNKLQQNKIIM